MCATSRVRSARSLPILSELLDGLPADLVDFMLRTAILDRLSGPLCEAVTGASSSRTILASLAQRQMLLMPLGNEGVWYRYHPLLAEYLRQRLEADGELKLPNCTGAPPFGTPRRNYGLRRSSTRSRPAISDRAIGWIKNCAMALITKVDLFTLLEWQRLFPGELMRGQPEVRLAIAWGLALALRFEEALQLATEIQQDVDAKNPREVICCGMPGDSAPLPSGSWMIPKGRCLWHRIA